MTRMVELKIVSPKGHDLLELDAVSAVTEIQRQVTDNNKWAFLDGNMVEDTSDLTIDQIVNAEEIQLTNRLIGG